MARLMCNHWNDDIISKVATLVMKSLNQPIYAWGNELCCLHCEAHYFFQNEELKAHCKTENHDLYIRPGNLSTTELYCGRCGDFQYSPMFDRLVHKKRPLITNESMFEISSPTNRITTTSSSLSSSSSSSSSSTSDSGLKRSLRNRKKGSRGICNMGSTCFISAVLQVLLHINSMWSNIQLQDSFIHEYPCHDDKPPTDGGSGCIVCELRNIFHENNIESVNPVVPAKLLYCVWNYADYLADYDQQDAHEFFLALMNGWTTHIRVNHHFPYKNAISPRVRDHQHSGVSQIFSGTMRSKLTCMYCGHESFRYEDFIDISLSVDIKAGKPLKVGESMSLNDCLKHFNTVEHLGEDVHCERCMRNRSAQKQLAIAYLPPVLVLHLKRFDAYNKRKIDSRVTFPVKNLDMSPFASSLSDDEDDSDHTSGQSSELNGNNKSDQNLELTMFDSDLPKLYDLLGVVTHIGTLAQGHYIAFVSKMIDGTLSWLRCDDENVTSVVESDVESAQGYLLFYGKQSHNHSKVKDLNDRIPKESSDSKDVDK